MTPEKFLNDRISLFCGDSREVLKTFADNSMDSIVCDPPYALVSIVKRFGSGNAAAVKVPEGGSGAYARASSGFMGKTWDTGETAFAVDFWAECLRVLKPGGHVVAFSGTRTYHRMASAIEDAGFEIRDMLSWLYGSGFPKSHDVSKGIDRAAGAERELTRAGAVKRDGYGDDWDTGSSTDRPRYDTPATDSAIEWQGWGTALKPAQEKICFAQKPNVFGADYDMIGSQIADLESSLWSMLPAKTAERNFGLSQSEFDAVCAFARWSADEKNNIRADLSEAMGTARFVLAITSSLNTVSLWKRTWAEGLRPENTSTIGTELSTTIDLRTLRFCLSKITPASIMQAHKSGLWSIANASTAERVFDATVKRLSGILESHALGNAIAQLAQHSLDVGAKVGDSPICFGRKPLIGTVAANVLQHGTGAINVDGCRVGTDENLNGGAYSGGSKNLADATSYATGVNAGEYIQPTGRWPANIIHDGSDEVIAAFPDVHGAGSARSGKFGGEYDATSYDMSGAREMGRFGDEGSAARFFYQTAKDDRCELCSANIAATRSPTKNTPTESSVICDALASQLPASAGNGKRSNGFADSAPSPSKPCLPPKASIAASGAQTRRLQKIVQNVSSAANLCGSCATAIAREIVAASRSEPLGLSVSKCSIDDFKKIILLRSLASYVESRENTDTILTTTNLRELFGCVFHAIAESTSSARSDLSTEPAPKRLCYSSKADADDRLGSKHPTVKPVDLMQWLCRLVTPKGGTVLDPFAGTGTTGEAAYREGFNAVLIEREPEYQSDIRRRMALCMAGPDERARESIKARTAGQPVDAGPLFAGSDTPPIGAGESTEFTRTKNRPGRIETLGVAK